MRLRLISALLILAVLACACMPAYAYKYGNDVAVEKLKEIERGDTFEIRIVQKKVVEGVFDQGLCDALVFTIRSDKRLDVSEVTIVYIPYDETNRNVEITDPCKAFRAITFSSSSDEMEVKLLTGACTPEALLAGMDIAEATNWYCFSGVRAIVKSYVTTDGTTVVNPQYEKWMRESIKGEQSDEEELD